MASPKQITPVKQPSVGNLSPVASEKKVTVTVANRRSIEVGVGTNMKRHLPGDKLSVTLSEADRLHKAGFLAKPNEAVQYDAQTIVTNTDSKVKIGLVDSRMSDEQPMAQPGMTSTVR